ncbi:MAG: hypothetical protein GYB31_18430 [Bacteroidetes bacterium]|nr:hypothetical protein [Bacteroidota bacterium]
MPSKAGSREPDFGFELEPGGKPNNLPESSVVSPPMKISTFAQIALLPLFFLFGFQQYVLACSIYKITVDGHTIVGSNQDAWRTTTCIWFVNPDEENPYGASFTGSRQVSPGKFAPQSGMNEAGLVFSRLAAYHPEENRDQSEKKRITNEVDYLEGVLRNCNNVKAVKKYIKSFDHSFFLEDVFIYVDKAGDYLIVEPYQLIEGHDPTYILANFCPSITSREDARKQPRYRDGEDYLFENSPQASLEYCRSLSDTMSVCRNRNGDGTLLTSIWDSQNGLVNLYFYHDFGSTVQFDIAESLARGNHLISIPELFSTNAEFQRLKDYKTPFNDNALRLVLALVGVGLLMLSLIFFISFFRKRKLDNYNPIKLLFAGINVLLFGYMIVLTTNINVYYFDAPYQHGGAGLYNASSYLPILLLLLIIPISFYTIRFLRLNSRSFFIKSFLILNNCVYLGLLYGFGYWGLFEVI